MCVTAFNKWLARIFASVGTRVARRPMLFIIGSLFVTISTAAVGLPRMARPDRNNFNFYVPHSSPGYIASTHIETEFGAFNKTARALVMGDIFDPQVFASARAFHDAMYDSGYSDVCILRGQTCALTSIFQLLAATPLPQSRQEVGAILNAHRDYAVNSLGFVDKTGDDITGAMQMMFFFGMDASKDYLPWEKNHFLRICMAERKRPHYLVKATAECMGAHSFMDEVDELIVRDVPLSVAAFMLMLVYTFTLLSKWRRPVLLHSYSVQSIMGIPFSTMSFMAAFIIFGVGIDDTFVFVDAYDRIIHTTDDSMSIDQRIEFSVSAALSEVGASITLTSVTDCVAFFAGATIDVDIIRGFCVTAGVAVVAVFILQSTLFAACLVFDERRRLSKRYDLCCCITSSSTKPVLNAVRKARFAWFERCLTVPASRCVVVFFIIAAAFSGWYGMTHLEKDLDFRNFLADDSYVAEFLDLESAGRSHQVPTHVTVVADNVDFNNNLHVQELDDLHTQLEAMESVDAIETRRSFFLAFKTWQSMNTKPAGMDGRDWLYQWSQTAEGQAFAADLVWNGRENRTLRASRFYIIVNQASGINKSVTDMKALRAVTAAATPHLKCYTHSRFFGVFDRFDTMLSYVLRCIASIPPLATKRALGGVFVVNLLFAHPLYAACSTFSVALVFVHIIFMMALTGEKLNLLILINLIMCIGFSVDFCAHICQFFQTHSHLAPKDRALRSVEHMGPSVLKAGTSTMLAVGFLVFSEGSAFRTLFRMFFTMVFAGLLHAVIFLPCALFLLATMAGSCQDLEPAIEVIQHHAEDKTEELSTGSTSGENRFPRRVEDERSSTDSTNKENKFYDPHPPVEISSTDSTTVENMFYAPPPI
eukprot:GEMP01014770.1.p1 GENE.GEMP01014770.1~~GEMP01014770.1.p1  ORF type:complete len:875 (+),score=159.88 GEMP01014770.1:42-2666(+)